jgi:hypothetical protein
MLFSNIKKGEKATLENLLPIYPSPLVTIEGFDLAGRIRAKHLANCLGQFGSKVAARMLCPMGVGRYTPSLGTNVWKLA